MFNQRVAVIVPIFKIQEDILSKCITSILEQSYTNLEILLIDDGNPEEYKDRIKSYEQTDDRIKVISHDTNKGLFQARITGVEAANSKYIVFVDADDHISVDWIRLLVKKCETTGADIVMGNTICETESNWKYVYNANLSFCSRKDADYENILGMLMKDEGLNFSLHTVWNKIYTKELWEKALSELKKVEKHLIMTEDILFTVVLFYYAKKMSFSPHDGYFYYRNSQSSTISTNDFNKCRKNIQDLKLVFDFVENFLKEKAIFEKYRSEFDGFKSRYFRWWSSTVSSVCDSLSDSGDKEKSRSLKDEFFSAFGETDFIFPNESDGYFDQKKTEWNNKYEEIKNCIVSSDYSVISFDMFDTLITRPFLNPGDVYRVVLSKVCISPYQPEMLIRLRELSEQYARKSIKDNYPQYEDVTIDEIYDVMSSRYNVSEMLCEKLKEAEKSCEIEFSNRRNSTFDLYELAVILNKKIYVTSDMYLDIETIKKILAKNGYDKISGILLSSSERMLKNTGNLFKRLEKVSGYKTDQIIHIGDNWNGDFVIPSNLKIKAFFMPKTKDILLNYLGDKYTGDSVGQALYNAGSLVDNTKFFDSFTNRCLFAISANLLFDNPFVCFNADSNYNGDPYFIGAFPYGIHIFGICKWIMEKAIDGGYKTVHFAARDGYYLKNICDLLNEMYYKSDVKTDYFYISRKSLIPVEACSEELIKNIVTNCSFASNTPLSIIERYNAVLRPLTDESEKQYKDNGFIITQKFATEDSFVIFLNLLAKYQYDEEKAKRSAELCKRYLKDTAEIGKDDLIFDLGYSGKLHKSIVKALGYNVDGLYLSKNGYEAEKRILDNGLNIDAYYDFIPSMQGIINEYIFSQRGPSCIGYENINGNVEPKFEERLKDNIGDYVVEEINRGAYDFASLLLTTLEKCYNMLLANHYSSGLLFEKFLIAPKHFDMAIFDYCYIEDEYYGGIAQMKLTEIWNWQISDRKLTYNTTTNTVYIEKNAPSKSIDEIAYDVYKEKVINRNLFIKGMYWLAVNKSFFKKRFKEHTKKSKNNK